jgi:AcrR family transcriptional regulator
VQLTRKRIIAAAMDLIERDGIEAISMDRLATNLGCGLVSLYSYVPSTSALLDGVADALLSSIKLPLGGATGWQDLIKAQAREFRVIATAWPRCTAVVISRPPPSASTLRPVERALGALSEAGFGAQDAMHIVRVLSAYVMGSVLAEIGATKGPVGADVQARRLRLRPAEFPHLTASGTAHNARTAAADFEFGLDMLMRSVAAMQPTRAVAS